MVRRALRKRPAPMSSVVEQTPYTSHVANGIATVFGYEFQLLDATDLVATADGVTVYDYTVSGIGAQGGGDITFAVAPANGVKILLSREIRLERDTDYQYAGDFREEVVDRDFNRLWQALQGLQAMVAGALRLPYPEAAAPLPDAGERANKLIGFDASGDRAFYPPAEGSATALATALASSVSSVEGLGMVGFNAAAAYAAATAGRAMRARGLSLSDYPYNAIGGGLDETAVIQAALDAAVAAGGGYVFGRPGADYKITSSLRVGFGVTLDLQRATVTQHTNNTPVVEVRAAAGNAIWSSVKNGILTYASNQSIANTNAVGLRLATLGRTNYHGRFEDLTVWRAYRGFDVPNLAGTFAFLVSFDNCQAYECSDYGWYIQGDTSTGGCTNVRLDGCYVSQPDGSEIATSKGFAFIGVSQLSVGNIAADHIQDASGLYLQLCSGSVASFASESCEFAYSSGIHEMVHVEGGDVSIGLIQCAANTVAISGTADFTMLRISTGAKLDVEHIRDLDTVVTDTSSGIYSAGLVSGTGNRARVWNYKAQGVTPAVVISEPSTVAQFTIWDGTDRTILIGTDPAYNPGNILDTDGETRPFTVPGVALGDRILWKAWSADLVGLTLDAWVSGTDEVKYRFFNSTGSSINLAAGDFTCGVQKA